MSNYNPGPLDISRINDGIKEMAEISIGGVLFTIVDNKIKVVGISKNGKDGTYGVPKGKMNITNDLFVEGPNETLEREIFEEARIEFGEDAKVIDRLRPESFNEELTYTYKDKDKGIIPEGKKVGDIKEKVHKTTELTPIVVAFQLSLLNKLIEGYNHVDGEEKGGYSEGKEREVKLINANEITTKFKKEQQKAILKAVEELQLKMKNNLLKEYILNEIEKFKNSTKEALNNTEINSNK